MTGTGLRGVEWGVGWRGGREGSGPLLPRPQELRSQRATQGHEGHIKKVKSTQPWLCCPEGRKSKEKVVLDKGLGHMSAA